MPGTQAHPVTPTAEAAAIPSPVSPVSSASQAAQVAATGAPPFIAPNPSRRNRWPAASMC